MAQLPDPDSAASTSWTDLPWPEQHVRLMTFRILSL